MSPTATLFPPFSFLLPLSLFSPLVPVRLFFFFFLSNSYLQGICGRDLRSGCPKIYIISRQNGVRAPRTLAKVRSTSQALSVAPFGQFKVQHL
ncbi:hypothetical protein F4814DRAFT_359348 [Daldinia grandis]|nr:hypothetical protein F4814DRAFT_359348 [Daldinia grandis]